MRFNNFFRTLIIFLSCGSVSHAGVIRTVNSTQDKMDTIHLSMGKSTVLHFIEKPVKVVLGNQNFFNVEFTGNDVTLQPLGYTSSNLFVYGEYYRYGFILSTGGGIYDDLVNVKRKVSIQHEEPKKEEAKVVVEKPKAVVVAPVQQHKTNQSITFKVEKVIRDVRGLSIIDLQLNLLDDKTTKIEKSLFKLIQNKASQEIIDFVSREDFLSKDKKETKVRIFSKIDITKAFKIAFNNQEQLIQGTGGKLLKK